MKNVEMLNEKINSVKFKWKKKIRRIIYKYYMCMHNWEYGNVYNGWTISQKHYAQQKINMKNKRNRM